MPRTVTPAHRRTTAIAWLLLCAVVVVAVLGGYSSVHGARHFHWSATVAAADHQALEQGPARASAHPQGAGHAEEHEGEDEDEHAATPADFVAGAADTPADGHAHPHHHTVYERHAHDDEAEDGDAVALADTHESAGGGDAGGLSQAPAPRVHLAPPAAAASLRAWRAAATSPVPTRSVAPPEHFPKG